MSESTEDMLEFLIEALTREVFLAQTRDQHIRAAANLAAARALRGRDEAA